MLYIFHYLIVVQLYHVLLEFPQFITTFKFVCRVTASKMFANNPDVTVF